MGGRKIATVLVALVFGLLTAAVSMAAEGPATIVLKGPAGKKAPVTFNHHKHQETLKCADCHHGKADDGTKVDFCEGQTIEGCATCHELGKSSDPMHKQCKGCHKTMGKGPNKCTECHPKAAE